MKKRIFDVYWATTVIPVLWVLSFAGIVIVLVYTYTEAGDYMSGWDTIQMMVTGAFMIIMIRLYLEVVSVLFEIKDAVKDLNQRPK